MPNEPLQIACKAVGGQKALADRLGVTQSMVWYWLERAKRGVPAEYVQAIEEATDGVVTRQHLRPDIFHSAEDAA